MLRFPRYGRAGPETETASGVPSTKRIESDIRPVTTSNVVGFPFRQFDEMTDTSNKEQSAQGRTQYAIRHRVRHRAAPAAVATDLAVDGDLRFRTRSFVTGTGQGSAASARKAAARSPVSVWADQVGRVLRIRPGGTGAARQGSALVGRETLARRRLAVDHRRRRRHSG
jgi:hypothetical protein